MLSFSKKIFPLSGSIVQVIKLKRLVFPAPFGPIIPKESPLGKEKLKSLATTTPPKDFEIFFNSKIDIKIKFSLGGDNFYLHPFYEFILAVTLQS